MNKPSELGIYSLIDVLSILKLPLPSFFQTSITYPWELPENTASLSPSLSISPTAWPKIDIRAFGSNVWLNFILLLFSIILPFSKV